MSYWHSPPFYGPSHPSEGAALCVVLGCGKLQKPQGGFYGVWGMGAAGNSQYIVYLFTPKVNIQFRF